MAASPPPPRRDPSTRSTSGPSGPLHTGSGSWWSRRSVLAAAAGALAAAVALTSGEMLAGLSDDVPSLVIAVADVFVDETPGGIVRWSIDVLGSTQETILVWGVVIGSLVVGGALGVATLRRAAAGVAGFAAFGLLGGWAADRSTGAGWTPWLASVLSAALGAGVLLFLVSQLGGVGPIVRRTPVRRHEPSGDDAEDRATETSARSPEDSRRRFVLAAGGAGVWALVAAAIGRRLNSEDATRDARAELADQLTTEPGAPEIVPADATFDDVRGLADYITPNDDFYIIDTALRPPLVDPDDWTLRIRGMVEEELELSFDDLLEMEREEHIITLSCVSNEVGGDLVDNARWSGVRLDALLARAGVHEGATQIVGRSVDDFTVGFPTEVALDGRPALVAVTMNGEPLPIDHGFPARLVVPGLYGYVSATKWLAEIELTTWEAFDAYWIPRGWAKEGPVRTQSRIDVPRSGATVDAPDVVLAGVAWAPHRGIRRVEVSIDDGEWTEARLNDEITDDAWRQWVVNRQLQPGGHTARVRATDRTGETQTSETSPPAPSGATGWHTVEFTVA